MIDIEWYNTLQDENIPGNQFCDQTQNGQFTSQNIREF